MGYRGKVQAQTSACDLRSQGWTYDEIAGELHVSKSSVSLWCREVVVDPRVWALRREQRALQRWSLRGPNALSRRKQDEVDRLLAEGRQRIGQLDEREFLVAGVALYAGEGAKRDGSVRFSNSDPRMILFFVDWLRRFFEIDETRLRLRLYLHDGLDLDHANRFWSDLTGISTAQFGKPYRATPDPSIRRSKHPMGCPAVIYNCSSTHRRIMGLVSALLSCDTSFRGGEIGITADC